MGVDYVDGEAIRFEFELSDNMTVVGVPQGEYNRSNHVIVKLPDGTVKRVTFATAIIAAGPWSAGIAEKLGIGKEGGMLSVPLPVEPRFVNKIFLISDHFSYAVFLN